LLTKFLPRFCPDKNEKTAVFSKWIYAMVATVVAQQHTLLQLGWNLQDLQRSLHEGLKIKAVAIRGDSVASPCFTSHFKTA